MAETLVSAARRRARYEVQLAADMEPGQWDDARYERMVRYVAQNIVQRGEDWRDWAETAPPAVGQQGATK